MKIPQVKIFKSSRASDLENKINAFIVDSQIREDDLVDVKLVMDEGSYKGLILYKERRS